MRNKPRFWTGISIYLIEVLFIAGFFLARLGTQKLAVAGGILAIILVNLFATILVVDGSRKNRENANEEEEDYDEE